MNTRKGGWWGMQELRLQKDSEVTSNFLETLSVYTGSRSRTDKWDEGGHARRIIRCHCIHVVNSSRGLCVKVAQSC